MSKIPLYDNKGIKINLIFYKKKKGPLRYKKRRFQNLSSNCSIWYLNQPCAPQKCRLWGPHVTNSDSHILRHSLLICILKFSEDILIQVSHWPKYGGKNTNYFCQNGQFRSWVWHFEFYHFYVYFMYIFMFYHLYVSF